jgi:hypothetical protein
MGAASDSDIACQPCTSRSAWTEETDRTPASEESPCERTHREGFLSQVSYLPTYPGATPRSPFGRHRPLNSFFPRAN